MIVHLAGLQLTPTITDRYLTYKLSVPNTLYTVQIDDMGDNFYLVQAFHDGKRIVVTESEQSLLHAVKLADNAIDLHELQSVTSISKDERVVTAQEGIKTLTEAANASAASWAKLSDNLRNNVEKWADQFANHASGSIE